MAHYANLRRGAWMTTFVVSPAGPPAEVMDDAQRIADSVDVERVRVEDAVDLQWFIRIEDSTHRMNKEEFDELKSEISSLVEGKNSAFKPYYGIGPDDDRCLVRIEY